jgi:RNA polymerase sigma-70 factor, ECF subfamily
MTIEEEKHLLQEIKGDLRKFGVLFDFYYNSIFSYIFRRVADYDTSRDIASETFLKAYLNIQSFVWKKISISSWLYRIATNEINLYFRTNRRYTTSFDHLSRYNRINIPVKEDYPDEKELLEKELELNHEFLKVRQCLAKLNLKYHEVLSLRYFEKKSIVEIAEILNKKEGTVKSLLSRGTEKLRILMNNAT